MAWKWKNGTSPTVLEIRFCRFQTLLTKISIWGLVFEQCPKRPKLVWNWQIELLYTIIFELGSSSLGGNIYLPKGQTFKEQIFDLGPGFWAVAQDLLEMAHNKTIELLLQIFELGSSYFWIVLTYPGNKHAFMAWFIIRIQIFGLWPKMCPNGPTLKNSTSLSVFELEFCLFQNAISLLCLRNSWIKLISCGRIFELWPRLGRTSKKSKFPSFLSLFIESSNFQDVVPIHIGCLKISIQ